ncbi:MAG: sulfatase-like hydrolase/transferase [Niabella sp.]
MENFFTIGSNGGKTKVFLTLLLSYLLFCRGVVNGQNDVDRPNILWIVSEDNSPFIGVYGDSLATTPNIDAFARQGVLFTNAYCTAPVCAPSRSTLITGMYPPAMGTENMRSAYPVPDFINFFPKYLRDAGYYTTNNSKKDYNTTDQPEVWDESGNKATYKNRKAGQPFFAVFNINTSHESSIFRSDAKKQMQAQFTGKPADSMQLPPEKPLRHDPDKMHIPAYLPATPEMKYDWALYYDKIQEMDEEVGHLLKELDDAGLSDNTIVFYYADNGGVLGRSKRFIFESGLHIPLIIRVPEKYRSLSGGLPGTASKQLVDFSDFAPTVLSLAGIEPPKYLQGRAFLGSYAVQKNRDFVFGFRGRMDEAIDLVRTIYDGRYRYVKNFMPHKIYGQHIEYLWLAKSMQSWEKAWHDGVLNSTQSAFFKTKPSEELYDVINDPQNIHNLAAKKEYRDVLEKLRKKTYDYLVEINDLGFIPEAAVADIVKTSTLYAYGRSGQYNIKRVLETAAEASSPGTSRIKNLMAKAKDPNAIVRYWVATGLLGLGRNAVPAEGILHSLLKDEKLYVAVVAAEALYQLSKKKEALPVLYDALNNDNQMVRLQALTALQQADKADLLPVAELIKSIAGNKTEYDSKAARYLLKRI